MFWISSEGTIVNIQQILTVSCTECYIVIDFIKEQKLTLKYKTEALAKQNFDFLAKACIPQTA